ncbi:hypothetical protein Nmel_016943 [Mimus melanotis]
MASQSQGIQQLLQAEKRAAEKVAEARKRKNRRLKQAKEEAQAEIEQYRLQREKEFKAKEAAVGFLHHSLLSSPFASCWGFPALAAPSGWSKLQQNFPKCLPVRHSHVSQKNPWKWLRTWCAASQLAGKDLSKFLGALRGGSLPKAAVCSSVQKGLSSLLLRQAHFHGADMAETTCCVPGHQKGRLRFL